MLIWKKKKLKFDAGVFYILCPSTSAICRWFRSNIRIYCIMSTAPMNRATRGLVYIQVHWEQGASIRKIIRVAYLREVRARKFADFGYIKWSHKCAAMHLAAKLGISTISTPEGIQFKSVRFAERARKTVVSTRMWRKQTQVCGFVKFEHEAWHCHRRYTWKSDELSWL